MIAGHAGPPTVLTPEAMEAHRAAWADLAARALEPSIFNDPGFALPAALHLAGRRGPRFLAAWDPRDPSRLVGLCCLAPPLPGLPRAAWLHPQATAAFPLLDAAAPEAALADLLEQAGSLLLHGLPADGATLRLIAARPGWSHRVLATRSRAVLRRAPPPLPGKAGKEFRRQARRLADQGDVAVTVTATPEAFDAFLALEAQGWKGRRATALASRPGSARFAREVGAALLTAGRCTVHTLTLDGRPVAAGLVLRSGPHAFFWKTAYDEAFARASPGAHLAAAIGAALAREPGLRLVDSCAIPGHAMIDRLWPERMTVADVFVAPAPAINRRQASTLALEQARRMLKQAAKRALAAGAARQAEPAPHS